MSFVRRAIDQAFRREHGRVLAALIPVVRDISEAEDLVGEAFQRALQHWPVEGIPERPGAWLLAVARNGALQVLRHRAVVEKRETELEQLQRRWSEAASTRFDGDLGAEYPDKRLELMFTCCHPALEEAARVALTLRTLGGLTTEEIARAFLVSETTMAQRLVRAKRKIALAKIPYSVPEPHRLDERIGSVLRVIYLIFTEGYRATRGEAWVRRELCDEAIELVTQLNLLLPDQPEALGLEALVRFHHARRNAREDERGIVLLEDQDRSSWLRGELSQAHRVLERALGFRRGGAYLLQAAIAAQHSMAPSFQETDWETITNLYERLHRVEPSPVVALNHAAALGMWQGPERALEHMQKMGLARPLHDYAPYHSARAELLRQVGRIAEARSAFERALELSTHPAEHAMLARRLHDLVLNAR